MFLRLVLLACLSAFVAAGPSVRRRFVWCDDLHECLAPYNVYGDPSNPTALAQLTEEQAVTAYCSSLTGMDTCVNNKKGSCWNDEEIAEAEAAVYVTNFFCAPENRNDLLAMARLENTCLDDASIDAQLEHEMNQCVQTFESDAMEMAFEIGFGMRPMTDLCPVANEMGDCMSRKVSNVCGPQVSEFFDKLIISVIDANTAQFSCPSRLRQLRRVVSRSLTMLRKR